MKTRELEYRERLEREKAELEEIQSQTEADRAPVELDQQSVGRLSRMDAMQQQSMAQEEQRRRVMRVRQIETALKRLNEGDFGFCISCDEEIAPARLELDPAVATCIACASGNRD